MEEGIERRRRGGVGRGTEGGMEGRRDGVRWMKRWRDERVHGGWQSME